MASPHEVQTYLAYWFQLGKPVHINNGKITQRPVPVLEGGRLSRAFQECWQKIMAVGGRDCYLDGAKETIEQLLSPEWEIIECARCDIPTVVSAVMPVARLCDCGDIDTWPNNELPAPHMPINNSNHFSKLKTRLDERPFSGHQVAHEDVSHKATVNNNQSES